MKNLILAICLLVFASCQTKQPEIIYVDNTGMKDTVYDMDFNVEKDKWLNDVLNNEKPIRIVNPYDKYSGNYEVRYKSIIFYGNKFIGPLAKYPDGRFFLYERRNQSEIHRVSQNTEDRIKKLFIPKN